MNFSERWGDKNSNNLINVLGDIESRRSDFLVNRLVHILLTFAGKSYKLFRFGLEWVWITRFHNINGHIGDTIDPDNNRSKGGLDRPSELISGIGKSLSMNIRKASIGVGG